MNESNHDRKLNIDPGHERDGAVIARQRATSPTVAADDLEERGRAPRARSHGQTIEQSRRSAPDRIDRDATGRVRSGRTNWRQSHRGQTPTKTGMNSKCIGVMVIVLLWVAPLRAGLSPAPDLEQLRFAALWPSSQPQKPHPAVVRVIAIDRNSLSLGSGSLVDANDEYGLVITNWHVVRDAVGPIEVVFPDGFHSLARVVRTDREWDLAALLIWKPPVQPVPISTEAPRPGEMLTIAGYGSGKYKMQSGPCTQYLAPAPGRPLEIVELAAAARHGDSGGPILNSRGELAGVLFGEGGGRTDGSYGGRVHKFLALTAKDLRNLPTNSLAKSGKPNAGAAVAAATSGPNAASTARFEGGINASRDEVAPAGWTESPAARVADRSGAGNAPRRSDASSKPLALAGDASQKSNAADPATSSTGFVWGDELKTFLAAFGVAAMVLHVIRCVTSKR